MVQRGGEGDEARVLVDREEAVPVSSGDAVSHGLPCRMSGETRALLEGRYHEAGCWRRLRIYIYISI